MKLKDVIGSGITFASLASAVVVTQDTVSYSPTAVDFSTVEVNNGVYFSIFNYGAVISPNAVQIDGQFFATAQSGNQGFAWDISAQTVNFNGLVVLDNRAASAATYTDFIPLTSFENSGFLYMLRIPL